LIKSESSQALFREKKVTLNHPIFARWPAQYPDRLQLFSLPTPNGVKVGIMLEETGLPYEPHRIDIMGGENHDPAFVALNPNGKIPAIYDPDGPSGTPLALFESGAILLYLADKTRQFISADPNRTSARATATQPNLRGCSVSSTRGSRAANG
jgi:GST-like protein